MSLDIPISVGPDDPEPRSNPLRHFTVPDGSTRTAGVLLANTRVASVHSKDLTGVPEISGSILCPGDHDPQPDGQPATPCPLCQLRYAKQSIRLVPCLLIDEAQIEVMRWPLSPAGKHLPRSYGGQTLRLVGTTVEVSEPLDYQRTGMYDYRVTRAAMRDGFVVDRQPIDAFRAKLAGDPDLLLSMYESWSAEALRDLPEIQRRLHARGLA